MKTRKTIALEIGSHRSMLAVGYVESVPVILIRTSRLVKIFGKKALLHQCTIDPQFTAV